MAAIDVLIPTCNRPGALAVTLATLVGQDFRDFDVLVADQSDNEAGFDNDCARAAIRVLEAHGHHVTLSRNLPRQGLAQQRQFLLEQATAPAVLFLDDDMILESDLLGRMARALDESHCGFVASAPIGLSWIADVRPEQQAVEFWDGPVQPERVRPDTPQWQRHLLHNAANLWHVQQILGMTPTVTSTDQLAQGRLAQGRSVQGRRAQDRPAHLYKIAWAGGCVLFDRVSLCGAGGFMFWRGLPAQHCGEDVLAQLRVMARHGGCGLMPSGAYHQELPTTVSDRRIDAPRYLGSSLDDSPADRHE